MRTKFYTVVIIFLSFTRRRWTAVPYDRRSYGVASSWCGGATSMGGSCSTGFRCGRSSCCAIRADSRRRWGATENSFGTTTPRGSAVRSCHRNGRRCRCNIVYFYLII